MATYLVDLENTGLAGLSGLEELSAKDKVIVFYGTRTGSIAFDKHVELTKARADVTYTKTERVAKNYLDFQLVTYLGYLIGSGQERVYYIISKDKGYDSCIEFWRKTDKQITITRCESLQKQKAAAQAGVQQTSAHTQTGARKSGRTASAKGGQTTQTAPIKKEQAASVKKEPAVQAAAVKNGQGTQTAAGKNEQPVQAAQAAGQNEQPVQAAQAAGQNEQPVQAAQSAPAESGEPAQNAPAESGEPAQNAAAENGQPQVQKDAAQERAKTGQQSGKPALPECMRKKVRAAVKEEKLASGSYKYIYDYIVQAPDKQKLNVALVKQFQQERGNRLYKEILDVFAEYQKQKAGEA